jgi:general secretion pathway protein J
MSDPKPTPRSPLAHDPLVRGSKQRGFTLIELMSALLILSLLAMMSFRGLGAVLDARDQVRQETEKWKSVAAFFARFQTDVQLSAPRAMNAASQRLEFSRFATPEGIDMPRRVAYALNGREIELSMWPGLDAAADVPPARYVVLSAVAQLELQYLDGALAWVDAWPRSERDAPLPVAVRLRIVLVSGEELVRVFALKS